ncbi:MAG: hypothetical protein Q8R08_02340 [bacterium]|nr:hypothetical protein [bacterium]
MIHKLRSKIKSFLAPILLHLAVAIDSPAMAAWVMAWVSWQIGKGQVRILCLGRSIFVDDLKAMVKYSGQIEYVVVRLQRFESILSYYVRGQERKAITEQNYYTTEAGRSGRRHYHEFLKRLLPLLRRKLGFDAILSGNLAYVVQQEPMRVAAQLGISFIVLHKEAMDVYGGILETYSSYKFFGTKFLFYNQLIRDEVVGRVQGLTMEKTVVVGIPRFDSYFRDSSKPKSKQITFFSFFPNDKFLATIKDEQKSAEIKSSYAAFHKLVIEFAAQHPDYKVTIKTKASPHYLNYVLNIYKEVHSNLLSNLTITSFAKASQLIHESEAIIGFDSTVLIEAIALGRPIVCPDFRDFSLDRSWDFLAGFEKLVNYVKTKADLEKFFTGEITYPDPEARKRFLHHLIGQTDGQASVRTEQEIIKTINEERSK